MRFIVLAIVLAFPAIDLIATVRFARWTGVPVWMWLALSTMAGFVLLRSERVAFRANTAAAMHGEQLALRGLFDSGRKVLAGVLFLLPGVNHCGGGPGTSTIDPFSPVVGWVENGLAPASMLGTAPAATPWPGRTRPLCPYPEYAHYKGSGDINVADNFECRADKHRGGDDEHEGRHDHDD